MDISLQLKSTTSKDLDKAINLLHIARQYFSGEFVAIDADGNETSDDGVPDFTAFSNMLVYGENNLESTKLLKGLLNQFLLDDTDSKKAIILAPLDFNTYSEYEDKCYVAYDIDKCFQFLEIEAGAETEDIERFLIIDGFEPLADIDNPRFMDLLERLKTLDTVHTFISTAGVLSSVLTEELLDLFRNRIVFKTELEITSQNLIGSNDAHYLGDNEFILYAGGAYQPFVIKDPAYIINI